MSEPIPASLKIPEVSRFISRANQLRTFKPAISYWCEYHAVNQIVNKGLHNADDDAFAFTKTLIERLEAVKTERPDDDAIIDNEAGQAFVEQFAQETFARAERTMHADKVTRQTADTFDAAATFFDLLHEWGQPDAEVLQKIKFAKWNAARILKAIRQGVDPNDSNPKQQQQEADGSEQLGDEGLAQLDPNDPEVQLIAGTGGGEEGAAPTAPPPQPATVEDVQDNGEPLATASSNVTQEGYFPSANHGGQPPLSSASATAPPLPSAIPSSQIPPQPSPQFPTKVPEPYSPSPVQPSSSLTTAPPLPPAADTPGAPLTMPSAPPADVFPAQQIPPPIVPPSAPMPDAAPVFQAASGAAAPPVAAQSFHTKDLNQAQKHAKWAISALNFEDVPTAIAELRNALATLGAQ